MNANKVNAAAKLEELQELLSKSQELAKELHLSEEAKTKEHWNNVQELIKGEDEEAYKQAWMAHEKSSRNANELEIIEVKIGFEIDRLSNVKF